MLIRPRPCTVASPCLAPKEGLHNHCIRSPVSLKEANSSGGVHYLHNTTQNAHATTCCLHPHCRHRGLLLLCLCGLLHGAFSQEPGGEPWIAI